MEYFPLTFFQQSFWDTLDYMNVNTLNLSCIMFFDRKLKTGLFKEAINRVIMNNDGFRIRLSKINDQVHQYVSDYKKTDIEVCDFRNIKDLSLLDEWMQKEDDKAMPLFGCDLFEFKILDFPVMTFEPVA